MNARSITITNNNVYQLNGHKLCTTKNVIRFLSKNKISDKIIKMAFSSLANQLVTEMALIKRNNRNLVTDRQRRQSSLTTVTNLTAMQWQLTSYQYILCIAENSIIAELELFLVLNE